MNSVVSNRWWLAGPVLLAIAIAALLAGSAGAAHLTGTSATYTEEDDFLEGTLINLQVVPDATNHHLKLLDAGAAFNFIWVAASQRGTVIKIDTVTGDILGEYRTAPEGMATNPSRTTVDANGNVWVGNRNEASGGQGSVTMIGLEENGQCGPSPTTSTGLGDILPWTNAGGADTAGGVSTAVDDCIRHFVRTPGTNVRTMAIDGSNDLWTGGLGNRVHAKVDSVTGTVVPGTTFTPPAPSCGGYGGIVDGNGILWSASLSNVLLRYDPSTGTGTCINLGRTSYGLGIDSAGNIWHSNFTFSTIQKIDPAGTILGTFGTGGASGDRGVAVTPDDHIWVANSFGSDVSRLDNAGNLLKVITVGSVPTGVAVDAAGKVWVTNLGSDNVMRIDPNAGGDGLGAVDLTKSLGAGAGPYNYSDMTGSTLTAAPDNGTWTVTHDSGVAGQEWGTITWNDEPEGSVPGDAQLTVEARSSNDGGVTWSAFEAVSYGVDLTVPDGQHLQVRVTFIRSSGGDSPTLSDLSIHAVDPVEPVLDGRMTGGGSVFTTDGVRVTHGFTLQCDASERPNNLQINWGQGRDSHRFHLEELTSALCTLDPAFDPAPPDASFNTYEGEGAGRYNGESGARAHWIFTDAGQPGVDDTAMIMVWDANGAPVLTVMGSLDRGNHQAHDK